MSKRQQKKLDRRKEYARAQIVWRKNQGRIVKEIWRVAQAPQTIE